MSVSVECDRCEHPMGADIVWCEECQQEVAAERVRSFIERCKIRGKYSEEAMRALEELAEELEAA